MERFKTFPYLYPMSKKVHNPHDKFVRETFSDPERAQAFIEEFLPADLVRDLNIPNLKVLKDSYLNKDLKEYFSDLILELEVKDSKEDSLKLALLFEHKSFPDEYVLIQVGHYLFSHLFKQIRQKKTLELVIPLIYYQGKQKWDVPNLLELFKNYPESVLEYVPQLKHIFISLNEISDEQISAIRNSMLSVALATQKLRFNPINLVKDFNRILKLFPLEQTDTNFFAQLIVYTFEVTDISEEAIAKSIENIPKPIKDKVMTTYQRIMNAGIEKGIEEGKIEEKIEMILAFFDDGIGIPQLAKAARITEKEVIKILKDNGRKV